MPRNVNWTVSNLRKIAKREAGKMPKGGRPLTPTEQIQRFMAGTEYQRVARGEITASQYARYQEAMLRKLGVEV